MSTSLREKIIGYLAQDISAAQVASACGVTPGYISQLLDVVEVREEIAVIRARKLEEHLATDKHIDSIEQLALRTIEQKLPFVKSAGEAAKVFATLNGARRKTADLQANADVVGAQQVTITVPRGAALHFKINETNQVIEVEGRTMAPLPSRALPALQKKLTADATVQDVQIAPVTAKERQEVADSQRAGKILQDLTLHMNGVAVVI